MHFFYCTVELWCFPWERWGRVSRANKSEWLEKWRYWPFWCPVDISGMLYSFKFKMLVIIFSYEILPTISITYPILQQAAFVMFLCSFDITYWWEFPAYYLLVLLRKLLQEYSLSWNCYFSCYLMEEQCIVSNHMVSKYRTIYVFLWAWNQVYVSRIQTNGHQINR